MYDQPIRKGNAQRRFYRHWRVHEIHKLKYNYIRDDRYAWVIFLIFLISITFTFTILGLKYNIFFGLGFLWIENPLVLKVFTDQSAR